MNKREIKFRAWNQTTKNMLDVTLIKWHQSGMMQVEVDDWNKTDTIMDEYELMQFTGLKDKNGKDIYESDIVKEEVTEQNYRVGFSNGCFCFMDHENDPVDLDYNCHYLANSGDMEVIGNVFENSELLKGGDGLRILKIKSYE